MQPEARCETLEVHFVALDGDAHGGTFACAGSGVHRDDDGVFELALDEKASDVVEVNGVGPTDVEGAIVFSGLDIIAVAEQYQRSNH